MNAQRDAAANERQQLCSWMDGLAREHSKVLASVAVREGLSATDALDAVQDALITLLGLPNAHAMAAQGDDVGGLLVVLVRNTARNARRRHHRSQVHLPVDENQVLDERASVDSLIAAAEEHAVMLGCVKKLGELQRHVVTLRLLEEVSGPDAARALGLTPGHLAVLLHRAKVALKECLDGQSGMIDEEPVIGASLAT